MAQLVPDRTEAAEYYFTYIDLVRLGPGQDVRDVLAAQRDELLAAFAGISEERSRHRYAPGKWSIREVLNHINDTERVFGFRAFWFGRGFDAPMPGFDQDPAVQASGAADRSWASHVEEFRAVRESTIALFRNLPADAWSRRGVASGHPVTVRALAFMVAGHAAHHRRILDERY
ncbi:MAG: DinB family protein [Vicinamibacterales bacterium]